MLTSFVLGSAVSGGSLIFAMPLAFASLLALRYPEQRISAPTGRLDETRGEVMSEETHGSAAPAPALDQRSGMGSVIGPERLESLRAAREHKRMASASDSNRAA